MKGAFSDSGESGLQNRIIRGLSWKFGSQLILLGTRIGLAVILARLLTPSEYGLAGMVLVFASFVLIFSDFGLGAALVQRAELSEQDQSTVFWTTLLAGVAFGLVGVVLAGPIAAFYGAPAVKPLLSVLSVSFVLSGLGTVQRSLLMRAMDFRKLEIRMIAATLASAAVAISLAALGYGAWSIIAQVLTMDAVSTTLLWTTSTWRPKLTFSKKSLRKFGGFGLNSFGARLLSDVNENADTLLIGRFLGAGSVGAYSLSYNVTLMPANRIVSPVQQVLFPAFSRMQSDSNRIADAWMRASLMIAAISLPTLAGLSVLAPDFVPVVLGDRWHASIPVIQILCWVGVVESLQRLNIIVLQARDRTRVLFRYWAFAVGANVAAFGIGLHWGIVGVATCYAVSVTVFLPVYTLITARAVNISVATIARRLAGVVQSAALMAAALLLGRLLLKYEGVQPAVRLPLLMLCGGVIFLASCAWRAREVLTTVRSVLVSTRMSKAKPTDLDLAAIEPEFESISGTTPLADPRA